MKPGKDIFDDRSCRALSCHRNAKAACRALPNHINLYAERCMMDVSKKERLGAGCTNFLEHLKGEQRDVVSSQRDVGLMHPLNDAILASLPKQKIRIYNYGCECIFN